MQHGQSLRLLQVKRDCTLASVGAEEEAALAGKARWKLAQHVSLRRLDRDDHGAQIGEQRAAVRAGEVAGQIEDSDARRAVRPESAVSLLLPRAERSDFFQYPLRPVDDRVIDEFAIDLDRRTALALRPCERVDNPLREGDLRRARGKDAVDYGDLVRVDAHLALEAEPESGTRRSLEPLLIRQIDPYRVERWFNTGCARRRDDSGAGVAQLRLFPGPCHVDIEREVSGTEGNAPDPGTRRQNLVNLAEAARRFDDRDQIDRPRLQPMLSFDLREKPIDRS